jgi:N-acetylglutamate synthase-like GNAT family acetyltransferase
MNQSRFRVRIAEAGDADAITSVINCAFRGVEHFFIDEDRIDVQTVINCLGAGSFLVAESDGVITGCVYVEPRGDRAYLGLLAVDPASQCGGLGSTLMNAGEDHCRKLGCRVMDIRIVNLREELPHFYGSRGYIETGTSPFPAEVRTKLPCHFIEMSKQLREHERESSVSRMMCS